jgi:hypothetical protein
MTPIGKSIGLCRAGRTFFHLHNSVGMLFSLSCSLCSFLVVITTIYTIGLQNRGNKNEQLVLTGQFCFVFGLGSSPLPPSKNTSNVLGYPYLADPYFFDVNLATPDTTGKETSPSKGYLSFSPPEVYLIFLVLVIQSLQSRSA